LKLNTLLLALALATTAGAQAQTASAPAGAAAPKPALPTSPAKKALVAKLLQLQQPGIEAMATQLAEQPARQMLQQAGPALQRIPAERREAVAKEVQADARKYVEEAAPVVRDRAVKLAPTTIGTMLEERLTEDELKQVIAILESPANRKFQAMAGDMQRALGEKLVADTRPLIEPKVRTLEETLRKRLEIPAGNGITPKQ
jgi:uncharacterized protein YqgV (UPF0045/DUF77 family)